MAVSGTTPILGLKKPIFRGNFWHEDMWENFDKIDAFSGLVPTEIVLGSKANIDSPHFTGDPQVPTAPLNDNDLSIANTQWVQKEIADGLATISQFFPCTDFDMLIGTTSARAVTPWAAYQLWKMNNDPNPVSASIILKFGAYFQMGDGTATITNINFEQNTAGRWAVIRWGNGGSVLSNTAGSNLFLPGGLPITTRQGDTMHIVMHGLSCIVTNYTRSQSDSNKYVLKNTTVYGGSTVYTAGADVTRIRVRAVGGGGGGGGGAAVGGGSAGSGGGGGGYVEAILSVTPGGSYVVAVGAGGNGAGGAEGSIAGTGGTTQFASGVLNVPGGVGGQTGLSVATAGSPHVIKGGFASAAPSGSGIVCAIRGTPGENGIRHAQNTAINSFWLAGGNGGGNPLGTGGQGALGVASVGSGLSSAPVSGFGAGGGGSIGQPSGSPGGIGGSAGCVIIDEFVFSEKV